LNQPVKEIPRPFDAVGITNAVVLDKYPVFNDKSDEPTKPEISIVYPVPCSVAS
jgi:hypothetical protein